MKKTREIKKKPASDGKLRLSSLKKGEFFRFKGHQKVRIFKGGGPVRGFNYTAADDVNDFGSTKTDREVETNFEY